jgi:hypothetical protein
MNGMENNTMVASTASNAHPVGMAEPPTQPTPDLHVNISSAYEPADTYTSVWLIGPVELARGGATVVIIVILVWLELLGLLALRVNPSYLYWSLSQSCRFKI